MNTENISQIVKELEKAIKVQKTFEKAKEMLDKTYGLVNTTDTYRINERLDDINEIIVQLIRVSSNYSSEDLFVHVVPYMESYSPNTLCDYSRYKGIFITIKDYLETSKKFNFCQECVDLINKFMIELAKAKGLLRINDTVSYKSKTFTKISFEEYEIEKMDISFDQLDEFLPKDEVLELLEEE